MSTRELVELAQLDAMGLLDEQEAREFEAAFAAAPVEIQEQIRSEQSRLCVLEPVLPDVKAPEHLRARVLASVHEAIVESIVESAPEPAMVSVKAQIPVEPKPAAMPQPVRQVVHGGGREIPATTETGRRRGVNVWRSTAIAFAAAAVVLGITTLRLQAQWDRVITQKNDSDSQEKLTGIFGNNTKDFFFSDKTERTLLVLADAMKHDASRGEEWSKVSAAVWHNADWSQAKLVCENLPSSNGERYQLVAINEEGGVRILGDNLQPTGGGLMPFSVSKDFTLKSERLALRVLDAATRQATIVLESRSTLG